MSVSVVSARALRIHRARGAVTVEYIVLVASVGIVVVVALVAFGPSFVRYFETTRAIALVPAP